jgi:drug/metabolite transporter (DMT)-like permease
MLKKYKTLLSDFGLFYAAAIWGSTFILVKDSLNSIDPVALVAYRFTLSAIVMAIVVLLMKKKLFSGFRYGLILGLLVWFLFIPQTIGLKYTTASNSGFITGLFIVFLPFFSALFFRIKPSVVKLISVGIALIGLWFLTGGLKQINIGDVLTLSAAVTYALHLLFADKFVKNNVDPYVLCFQQFFVVGILSFIAGFFMKVPLYFSGMKPLFVIIFLALFPGVSAFMIQLIAQKHTSPIKVGLIFILEPVFAAIFAWTLGGEQFIARNAFGGLLIVIAMIIAELPLEKIWKIKNEKTQ